MAIRGTVLIAAVCTLALPVGAFADGGEESHGTAATSPRSERTAERRDCVDCTRHAHDAAAQRRVSRSARTAPLAEAVELAPMTTLHVDSTIRRRVAPNCEYVAVTDGTYQSDDPAGRDPSGSIQNVDVRGDATLMCYGEVVRRRTHHFVFPTITRGELAALLAARLETSVPGTPCAWSSTYDFQGGDLHASAVIATNCSPDRRQLALRDYGSSGTHVAGSVRSFDGPAARGGGPVIRRDPDSFDARIGAH